MKREVIEKVVEKAVECNFISLNDCTLSEDERKQEIIEVIKRDIDEENKKAIEAIVNEFGDYVLEAAKYTTTDDSTGEQRPLTTEEMAELIYGEYWRIQGEISEVINE
ncbi:MAG: hypothetical protein J6F30_13165 [Cellulosilyticum sp.]|nr:hypothetical protein [Cellulosilyticum sp.]